MNKLKENIFAIAVGGMGIVLLVLLFFLVLRPLQSLGDKERKIDAETKNFAALAKRKELAIRPFLELLRKKKDANEAALKEGIAFYEEQAKTFLSYFDGATDPPPLNQFQTAYVDAIKKLVDEYRVKFGIKVEAEAKEGAPPKISQVELAEDTRIPVAMKEFWIIQEIFQALNKLEIGGLKEIDFPSRLVEPKEPPPYRRHVSATVRVEILFSKIEPLLTELYSSKTVPFILEEFTYQKIQDPNSPSRIGEYQALQRDKDFKKEADASKDKYETLIPEPNVMATLKLIAIDWKGIPEEKETEKESEESAPTPKTTKKTPTK